MVPGGAGQRQLPPISAMKKKRQKASITSSALVRSTVCQVSTSLAVIIKSSYNPTLMMILRVAMSPGGILHVAMSPGYTPSCMGPLCFQFCFLCNLSDNWAKPERILGRHVPREAPVLFTSYVGPMLVIGNPICTNRIFLRITALIGANPPT
ncbi:unnamed protein product [Prunus armeniaca]|uniref:Uncharacterized protein n=1 Tax=Prunus armeniaca TaxID=36596 RepID=A0A6J5WGL6_PRUAR|nr:unnamed protein product [Prunus armeniaca]